MDMRLPQQGAPAIVERGSKPLITFTTILGTISVAVFVITEMAAIAYAVIWSITGYFAMPQVASVIFALLIGLPSVWLAGIVLRLSFRAETDPENN